MGFDTRQIHRSLDARERQRVRPGGQRRLEKSDASLSPHSAMRALLELNSDLTPRLRAPPGVQHHAQDAVDAQPRVPEAGVDTRGISPPGQGAPGGPPKR